MTRDHAKSDWAADAEARILDAALDLTPDSGWTLRTVHLAAARAGLSDADAGLLLPNGPADLAALLSRRHDAAALQALAGVDPRNLKVRDRIARGVQARVEAAAADAPAVRRLLGFLALPHHMGLGARLLWDKRRRPVALGRRYGGRRKPLFKAGDPVGGAGPAIAIRLASGREAADAYVGRRISDVMAFERWKTGLPKTDIAAHIAGALGRVRYGFKGSAEPPASR